MDFEYQLIDADSHYYEPDDCFTRCIEPSFRDRAVNIRRGDDGLGRIFIGDRRLGYLSVHQSDHILPPGALQSFFAGEQDRAEVQPEPIRGRDLPDAVDRDARLAAMDEQNLQATILLPTLGVCVEHELSDDVDALYANLRAFNRWMEEEWGYAHQERLFAVPMLSLLDIDQAVAELDRVVAAGARIVHLKPGPVYGRSPASPDFDPFWARASEAGVPVLFHIGDSGYNELVSVHWGEEPRVPTHQLSHFQSVIGMFRPIEDTMAALVLHNLFGRFPDLRVMCIEQGSFWVPNLLQLMDKAHKARPGSAGQGGRLHDVPSNIFREHVYVAPFHEEDIASLVELIGADRVLFGSDYPHPEGVAPPAEFAHGLAGLDDAVVRRIMRDNAAGLLGLDPAA
ncbi:MAG TPA: amidohydrolase family protein [Nitriliruptorales bacterium]